MISKKGDGIFKAMTFLLGLALYVAASAGAIWFVADTENRLTRLEKIVVDAGLWPAGEPAPKSDKRE